MASWMAFNTSFSSFVARIALESPTFAITRCWPWEEETHTQASEGRFQKIALIQ
jgi:hypothetical protein